MPFGLSLTNVCVRQEFMTSMSCDSIYCMCGAAWSSHWLTMQLTNGQHACVLVFVPNAEILNIICDYQFVFCVLDERHVSDQIRVNYKSMKCDVILSQRSVSTIFRWGGHFSYTCKKSSSCLQQCKNYKNRRRFSRVMTTNVLPHFYGSQCIYWVGPAWQFEIQQNTMKINYTMLRYRRDGARRRSLRRSRSSRSLEVLVPSENPCDFHFLK